MSTEAPEKSGNNAGFWISMAVLLGFFLFIAIGFGVAFLLV